MKPVWKDGALKVELHKPDRAILDKARDIGNTMTAMHQEAGKALVAAIDAILIEKETDAY